MIQILKNFVRFSLAAIQSVPNVLKIARALLVTQTNNTLLVTSGGFGHTIAEPALFLSLTKGDGICIVVGSRTKINPQSALLFGQSFVPIYLWPGFANFSGELPIISSAYSTVVNWLCNFLGRDVWDLRRLNEAGSLGGFDDLSERAWLGLFYQQSFKGEYEHFFRPSLRVREAFRFLESSETVCFYLRGKGKGSAQLDDAQRDGGFADSYEALIKLFLNNGIMVLLMGEEAKFRGARVAKLEGCFTFEKLGLSSSEMNLCAPIMADYFVGNAGGGCILPVMFRKKSLIVDGFGFWYGIPNALHAYKLQVDRRGKDISSLHRFAQDIYNPLPDEPGMSFRNFSSDEQTALGEEFLRLIREPEWNHRLRGVKFSKESWLANSPGAILSEVYVNLNRGTTRGH